MVKVVFPIFKALTFIKHVPFDQSIFDTLGKVAIDVSEKVYPILCIPSPVNLHEKLVSLPSLRFNEFTPNCIENGTFLIVTVFTPNSVFFHGSCASIA